MPSLRKWDEGCIMCYMIRERKRMLIKLDDIITAVFIVLMFLCGLALSVR